MPVQLRKVLLAISVLMVFALACGQLGPTRMEREIRVANETATAAASAPRATVPTQDPRKPESTATRPLPITVAPDLAAPGECRWRNYEISPPSNKTSNPNMEINVSPGAILTTLKHGVSGCPDQFFYTQHRYFFFDVMYPGQEDEIRVELEWMNQGTADCAALIAGGLTTITIGDFRLRAEEESINVKTMPRGLIIDKAFWTPPEGEIGDTFTIVVHASTGSYGTNARYRFEYVCD